MDLEKTSESALPDSAVKTTYLILAFCVVLVMYSDADPTCGAGLGPE
jgi:hypothetical protein